MTAHARNLFMYGTLMDEVLEKDTKNIGDMTYMYKAQTAKKYYMYNYKDIFPVILENPIHKNDPLVFVQGIVCRIESEQCWDTIRKIENVPNLYLLVGIKILTEFNNLESCSVCMGSSSFESEQVKEHMKTIHSGIWQKNFRVYEYDDRVS